jgi:hypothetical protein
MAPSVMRILFFILWTIVGIFYAYQLWFHPEWFDKRLERTGRILQQHPIDKKRRLIQYRSLSVVLFCFAMFALYISVNDIVALSTR